MVKKGLGEGIFGLACLSLWMAIFAVGILVPSGQYRDMLARAIDIKTLVLAAVTFTYTNVALLTCLAGLLGGIASRLTFKGYDVALDEGATPASKPAHSISHAYRTENPAASMMRGFLVFVVYLAGLAIGMPGGVLPGSGAGAGADVFSFSATTPDQYARLAALLSAIAFGAGYDPTMFGSVWSLMPAALKKRKVSEH